MTANFVLDNGVLNST